MALTKCPECGNEVSSKTTACPHCGYPLVSVEDGAPAQALSSHEQDVQNGASASAASAAATDGPTVTAGARIAANDQSKAVGQIGKERGSGGRTMAVLRWTLVAGAAVMMGVGGLLFWQRSSASRNKREGIVPARSVNEARSGAEDGGAYGGRDRALLRLGLVRSSAEKGDAAAQRQLGVIFADGDGVTKDLVEAVKWYRKAADQGDAFAQFNLGVCYESGADVAKNQIEAVKWYRKAAEQGTARAQFNLGVCYDKGEGVNQDPAEAVKWYRRAAEQGSADAQINLGRMYAYGDGVNQDPAEGVKWFRKAAEQGDADAQFMLGYIYFSSMGVTKNDLEALAWLNVSAASGNVRAAKYRDILESAVGPQAVLEAQQRSREILRTIEASRAR